MMEKQQQKKALDPLHKPHFPNCLQLRAAFREAHFISLSTRANTAESVFWVFWYTNGSSDTVYYQF